MATLQPGVNSVRNQAGTTATNSNRAVRGYGNALTINGHSPYENTYRIDGINENDYSNGSPGSPAGVNLGVDAIQEFSVVTTAYTAEYGRTSGGVINAVTRSGTNTVHGTAFLFDRDKLFDAKNPFDNAALPIPGYHRTQFGGSVGLPIRKDKTFFFTSYEGYRSGQSLNLVSVVPSHNAKLGLLSTGTVAVSPSILPYLGLYPDPQTANLSNGDAGTYNTTGPIQIRENFSQTRIDNSFSPKDSLSLTYLVDEAGETLPDILVNIVSLNHDERELGAITERHLFSNNLINVLRLGYNRNVSLGFVPLTAPNPVAGNTNLGYQPGFTPPLITIPGFASLSGLGSSRPSEVYFNSYQLNDDFALTKGKHNIKVGFAAERILSDIYAPLPHGNVAFLSFANFLKDVPYAAQFPGADSTVESANSIIGGYVQDDWRFSRQLSLNLGLRYEISTLPYDRKNALGLINSLSARQVPVLARR